MQLISIEPTPSPNTMKLNVDTTLPSGITHNFSRNQAAQAPDKLRELLQINGVKALFQAADFIALDRLPKGDWPSILTEARSILGESPQSPAEGAPLQQASPPADAWGEVEVKLQNFRGIPLQVRVSINGQEARAALPQRFADAAIRAASASPNLIKERQLTEFGVRYGELSEVLDDLVQELDATYDDLGLEALVLKAADPAYAAESSGLESESAANVSANTAPSLPELSDEDWKVRYHALQRIRPSLETLPLLAQTLKDEQTSIRRLAAVYIGDIKEPEALPYLFDALQDPSPAVRRTVGDTLSDLGDPAAIPAMIEALRDTNKLVRWRAARFLYEVGDETALDALRVAATDAEFEIAMQARIALERIEGGYAAEGSVWQQMTRRNDA